LKSAISNMAAPTIRNIGTIGGNICNASPAGDTLPPLYILDAKIVLSSIDNQRIIPIDKFIIGPGRNDLKDDELLTEILIPNKKFNKEFYKKLGTRKAMALSKISFAGLAEIEDDKIEDIRIAFGAVAPKIVRSRTIEQEIIGHNINEINELSYSIVKEYSEFICPIDDQRSSSIYRKQISIKLLDYFLNNLDNI